MGISGVDHAKYVGAKDYAREEQQNDARDPKMPGKHLHEDADRECNRDGQLWMRSVGWARHGRIIRAEPDVGKLRCDVFAPRR